MGAQYLPAIIVAASAASELNEEREQSEAAEKLHCRLYTTSKMSRQQSPKRTEYLLAGRNRSDTQ